jgi:putative membrane protein insertion efficiency factor
MMMKRLATAPIRFYQRWLSPLKRRPSCRYVPTCSQYALEAIESRGVLVGSLKALWRLLRCNPLFRGGFDPVDRRAERMRHLPPSCEHDHELGASTITGHHGPCHR